MLSIAEQLGWEGPLARKLPDYAPRSQQQEMAEAVARAIDDYRVLVCEAGTGTGKTFAYLVPALLSGRKVIISTGTKSLQEQLFYRDLPVVREALGTPARTALLKGRTNYLCLQRLTTALADVHAPRPNAMLRQLQLVADWATTTETGDISEMPGLPEGAMVWRHATSTVDNCLGQDCPRIGECFVLKARRAAIEADIVVVNHHLFFADVALREEGFGELLPGADAVVLDEAHQVPDIATQFFGSSVSGRQLLELARDTVGAYHHEAGDMPELPAKASVLEQHVRDLRLTFGPDPKRVAWDELGRAPKVQVALDEMMRVMTSLQAALGSLAERGRELERCHRRCLDLVERLILMTETVGDEYLQWVDVSPKSFTFHMTPLDISGQFGDRVRARRCAWIFTSATLAVRGRFSHFAERLGLDDREEGLWGSPFDFERQALGYLPPDLPDPNSRDYTDRVVAAALPVLQASQGRAFLLFTSHRALRQAAEKLPGRIDYPMFVQGEKPRNQLLERFRTTPNSVLLGTSSFWEGVDVRGEALSCVVIDKLPFPSPGDPVLQSRNAAIRESGGNPFLEHQLPQAVIALKQGVGRLIRGPSDGGVVVLCDPRLCTSIYGRVFLESLPPIPMTQDLHEVLRFFGE